MIYKSIEIITCFQKNKSSKFYKFNHELIIDIINPKKNQKIGLPIP